MIIDTQKKVFAIQLRRMIALFLLVILISVILLLIKRHNTLFGMNKYHWAIIVGAIFVGLGVFEGLLNYCYIYFNDEKDKIVLRYFSLGYFNRVKKAIEFPKNELLSYQVYEYMKGYKKTLVLHRTRNDKDAKYPPVSLSILKKEEQDELLAALDQYKKY